MRKVVALENVTLDGFAASNEGMGLEWTFRGMDSDVFQFSHEAYGDADTAMYGRRTYLGMQEVWTSVPDNTASSQGELDHARWVEAVDKIVFPTTMESALWSNSRLIKDNVAEEVDSLKRGPGGALVIFGSPTLVHSFISLGLVDEYRIFVHPVVLGSGTPLFPDIKETMNLDLVDSRVFRTGVTYLRYQNA
jgi:dihydrofolate reductase